MQQEQVMEGAQGTQGVQNVQGERAERRVGIQGVQGSRGPQDILILGGGLGGYYVAKGLERQLKPGEANVTLVDVRSSCVYQPFLAEVVSGAIEPRHVLTPLRRHLPRTNVLQARVEAISAADKAVTVSAAGEAWQIPFDQLVVALGAVTKTFPTPGVAESAIGLKGVEEAQSVRNRIVQNFDTAASLPQGSPARKRLLSVVVVGGGFSGVECMAEICDLVRIMLKHRPSIDPAEVSLHLVEAADRILPELPVKHSTWVIKQLGKRRGHVHLNSMVTDASNGVVTTSTGESFDAGVLVWTTGVMACPAMRNGDLPLDVRGRLICGDDLRVRASVGEDAEVVPGVWGVGDATCVPDKTGAGMPDGSCAPTAQHAVRQARVLASNLVATVRAGRAGEGAEASGPGDPGSAGGQPASVVPGEGVTAPELAHYYHENAGMVAGLGTGKGVFASGKQKLIIRGWPAWLMHRGYHGLALPSWERKLRVFGDWTATFVIKRDSTTTMGTLGTEDPRAFFEEFAVHPRSDAE